MSDVFLPEIADDDWLKEDEILGSPGNVRYAKARLYYPLNVTPFVSVANGGTFTLSGVYHDRFDNGASIREGLKQFNGKKLNSDSENWIVIFVCEFTDKNGNPYQRMLNIRQMCNWKEKDDNGEYLPNLWNDFQKAEIAKLPKPNREALIDAARKSTWACISFTEKDTGYMGEFEAKKYWADITVYPGEAEWQAAKNAYFAQFGNDDEPNHYPASWQGEIEKWLNYGRSEQAGVDDSTLAEKLQLTAAGVVAKDTDGNNVDVAAILAEVREEPF